MVEGRGPGEGRRERQASVRSQGRARGHQHRAGRRERRWRGGVICARRDAAGWAYYRPRQHEACARGSLPGMSARRRDGRHARVTRSLPPLLEAGLSCSACWWLRFATGPASTLQPHPTPTHIPPLPSTSNEAGLTPLSSFPTTQANEDNHLSHLTCTKAARSHHLQRPPHTLPHQPTTHPELRSQPHRCQVAKG